MKKIVVFLSVTMVLFSSSLFAKDLIFTPKDISKWSVRYFLDKTHYSIVNSENETFDDIPSDGALLASSNGASSALFYKSKIDLSKTPWLSWSWKVEQFPTINNERSKGGDDFAGRVYIVFNQGTVFSTKGVSYVWTQQAEKGDVWENPFAGEKMYMYSIETSEDTGVWRNGQRNIREDLKAIFGEDIRHLAAIAIMTDADNSSSKAQALYGNIRLTKEKYVFLSK